MLNVLIGQNYFYGVATSWIYVVIKTTHPKIITRDKSGIRQKLRLQKARVAFRYALAWSAHATPERYWMLLDSQLLVNSSLVPDFNR